MPSNRLALSLLFALLFSVGTAMAQIGDGPVITEHIDQSKIDAGQLTFEEIHAAGAHLFRAKFNTYDGQGRPATTGGGAEREAGSAPRFIRTSAPDANSCAGCHNEPRVGGAGDIVANVFVLAQTLDPVTDSVSAEFSNERNTLGMHGAGPIEMLAREMTADLQSIRQAAIDEAVAAGSSVTKNLKSKGVYFGTITAAADGSVDTSDIEGVDADLIIKPFHQKGAVISLREFSNNAMNHHHGMQSVERFGEARTGNSDFDKDGVENELTEGDITAISVYQAGLATPGQVIPNDLHKARAIIRGERIFSRIGCADCHVPELTLESAIFTEPNPYNPAGNLNPSNVSQVFSFDMTTQGDAPRIEAKPGGGAIVRAFTDLKRHNLCDGDYDHYCNEQIEQGGIDTRMFLTRKLWDVGNTAPYGHKGDLTTITEAIYYHGGEARDSRDAFFEMSQSERDQVVEFLKSLQILDEGIEHLVVDENGNFKRNQEEHPPQKPTIANPNHPR